MKGLKPKHILNNIMMLLWLKQFGTTFHIGVNTWKIILGQLASALEEKKLLAPI